MERRELVAIWNGPHLYWPDPALVPGVFKLGKLLIATMLYGRDFNCVLHKKREYACAKRADAGPGLRGSYALVIESDRRVRSCIVR